MEHILAYVAIALVIMSVLILLHARSTKVDWSSREMKRMSRDYADARHGRGWHERNRRGW